MPVFGDDDEEPPFKTLDPEKAKAIRSREMIHTIKGMTPRERSEFFDLLKGQFCINCGDDHPTDNCKCDVDPWTD